MDVRPINKLVGPHTSIKNGPKTGLFLRVDNFTTFKGRKTGDKSKVLEFCLEKNETCKSVNLNILYLVCINLDYT